MNNLYKLNIIPIIMEDTEELKEGEENLLDDETKKKTTRNTLIAIASLIIIFALIFGINYLYKKTYRNPYDYDYNGFKFQKYSDGKWYTQIRWNNNLVNIPLSFGPRDLEDIQLTGTVDERFMSRDIYITFDPAEDILLPTGAIVKEKLGYLALAASELSLNLVQGMKFTTLSACTKNDSSCGDVPVITCENGNATIYLKRDDKAEVLLDGNCVIVSGKDMDLVRAVDRLLLYWYRIMD